MPHYLSIKNTYGPFHTGVLKLRRGATVLSDLFTFSDQGRIFTG
jgi:hypothetical protein